MTPEEHIRALNDPGRREFEGHLGRVQQRADAAAARGDVANQRLWLDHLEGLKSLPLPWEKPTPV